jgi:hypothetical protein
MQSKVLFLLSAFLLGLSSCIKVSDEVLTCRNSIPAPVPLYDTLLLAVGDYVKVELANYNNSIEYKLITPSGQVYSNRNGYYPFHITLDNYNSFREFKLVAGANSLCQSDTTGFFFNVVTTPQGCGMANNSFKVNSNTPESTTVTSATNYSSWYHTQWTFSNKTLTMNFGDRPSQSYVYAYRVRNNPDFYYLADNEVAVSYQDNFGNTVYATSGYVYTTYSLGKITYTFCSLPLTNTSTVSGNISSYF